MPGAEPHTGAGAGSTSSRTDAIERKLPEIETGPAVVDVLSVSPIPSDHATLERFLCRSKWTIHKASTLAAGVELLRQKRVSLAICERDLRPGSWKELLAQISRLPQPPLLIVTSRLADECLWAEALNLGAYDVLSKPLEPGEVVRVLGSAWLRWNLQYGVPTAPRQATAVQVA